MNSTNGDRFHYKHYIITLILVILFYVAAKLLFEVIYNINAIELQNQSKYGSAAIVFDRIYLRYSFELIAAGVLYGLLGRISKPGQILIKIPFDVRKYILWVLPCSILFLWHAVWWFFSRSVAVPYPPYHSLMRSDFPMPHLHVFLLLLFGYMIVTPLFHMHPKRLKFLWPAAFFIISIVAAMAFDRSMENNALVSRYSLSEYFMLFAIYSGIGVIFGFTYCIAGKLKMPGVWAIDWYRIIIWCGSSFAFILYDGLAHLNLEGGVIRFSTLLWMFIFGNSITTSINKKDKDTVIGFKNPIQQE